MILYLTVVDFCSIYVLSSLEGVIAHDGGFNWKDVALAGLGYRGSDSRELLIEKVGALRP